MPSRSGGEILVANLIAQGATHAFGVPGESFLPVLDALYGVRDRLTFVVCRHEGGAADMPFDCGYRGRVAGVRGSAVEYHVSVEAEPRLSELRD